MATTSARRYEARISSSGCNGSARRIERDAGNLRAALGWLLDQRQLDAFAELAWALWVPAWINGRIEEGRTLARAALESEGSMSEGARARLLVVVGTFSMWSGDHVEAETALDEGRTLAESLGDDDAVAAATLATSMIVGPAEGEARAEDLAREAWGRFQQLGDRWGEAAALNVLGWLYVAQERFEGARDTFEQTLAAAMAVGDEQFSAMAEVNLAEYHLDGGDRRAAADLLASCAQRHRALRLMYSAAYLLESAGRLAAHGGDDVGAARLLGAASHLRETTGVSVWGSQRERRDRLVEVVRASLGPAEFAATFASGSELSYAEAIDEVTRSTENA